MKDDLFQEIWIVWRIVVGGICGENSGTISQCCTIGQIGVHWNEKDVSTRFGGICGRNDGGVIISSYNKSDILVDSANRDPGAGGVCGVSIGGSVLSTYNMGNLTLNNRI